jgi:hypothetical protein
MAGVPRATVVLPAPTRPARGAEETPDSDSRLLYLVPDASKHVTMRDDEYETKIPPQTDSRHTGGGERCSDDNMMW